LELRSSWATFSSACGSRGDLADHSRLPHADENVAQELRSSNQRQQYEKDGC